MAASAGCLTQSTTWLRSEISVQTVMSPSGGIVIPAVFFHQDEISALSIFTAIWTPVIPEEMGEFEIIWTEGMDEVSSFRVRDTCRVKRERLWERCHHLEVILDVQFCARKPLKCTVHSVTFL